MEKRWLGIIVDFSYLKNQSSVLVAYKKKSAIKSEQGNQLQDEKKKLWLSSRNGFVGWSQQKVSDKKWARRKIEQKQQKIVINGIHMTLNFGFWNA